MKSLNDIDVVSMQTAHVAKRFRVLSRSALPFIMFTKSIPTIAQMLLLTRRILS